jgi:Tfp pilus assembly protein PilF
MQAGFIWDDDAYVAENPVLKSPDGLSDIWFTIGATPQYYPLVFTTFCLEYRIRGINPVGFHTVKILIHGLAAVLLWRILLRLKLPVAWYAAALFALHPVQVESVAWITERKNTLSAMFYFAAALSYLRWRPPEHDSESVRRSFDYWLAAFLYVAALFSKTVTCSLPAALLVIQWWKRGTVTRRDVVPLLPMLVAGIALGSVTRWIETNQVGTKFVSGDLSFMDRWLIAGRACWFYVGKLVCPLELAFIYPRWVVDVTDWRQLLYPVGVVAVIAGLWLLRRRIGRGPVAAILLFVGTLFPALGFIDIYPMRFSFVADHFQYLATPAILVLMASAQHRLLTGNSSRRLFAITAGIVLTGLCILTSTQCRIYASSETLWNATNRINPNSQLVHTHLGVAALEHGRYADAKTHLRKALQLDPDFEAAHLALGVLLARNGELPNAAMHLKLAVESDPRSFRANVELARVFRRLGEYERSLDCYRAARNIDQNASGVIVEAAVVMQQSKRFDDAIRLYQEAIDVEPGNALIYYNQGVLFEVMQRPVDAETAYRQAMLLNAFDARTYYNLGNVLIKRKEFTEAVQHYRTAIRLNPNFEDAHQNLRTALQEMNHNASTAPRK